jgi:sugar O-acyltransferase (sialic acid O-acetyltransferase NeuD family)
MSVTETAGLPLILLGAGGHAKVILELAKSVGLVVQGICDPGLAEAGATAWRGIPVLGGDDVLDKIDPRHVALIHGIGQLVGQGLRGRLYSRLRAKGFTFPVLVHPAAWVASTAQLGPGVQIMAGVVVQPDCWIGENSIINTRASVDHDCSIGKHVHIAPSATLCGGVTVEDGAFVGSGATVIPGVRIGEGSVVGAGVTLVRDLPLGAQVIGTPVRFSIAAPQEYPD